MISLMTFRMLTVLLLTWACPSLLWAQEIEELKRGVVKITATVEGKTKVGTGFIVSLEREKAYIVTAAHVVEGDPKPRVAFFPRENESVPAEVLGIEGGDPRGLAALLVKEKIPKGLRAFSINTKTTIRGSESVTVIGFPRETATPWMVTTGTVGGRKGSDLTFSGIVGEGNSGGPLLLNGKVVGIITQMGSKISYAVPIISARFAIEGWGIALKEGDEAQLAKEIIGKDGVRMILVPAGEFPMGEEKQQIYLDKFYIDKNLALDNGRVAKNESWHGAEKYCRERGKRLPTEAEWEKAAKGLSIKDLGSSYEWVGDWYQSDYPAVRPNRNPKGPPSGEFNDEELLRWESEAKRRAEEYADSVCSGSSGTSICFEGVCKEEPKCKGSDWRNRMQGEFRSQMQYRPVRDMEQVVRKNPDTRGGFLSRISHKDLGFRCAQDAPKK